LAEGTSLRLDTVDIADSSGWDVVSTRGIDIFTKGDASIEVRYSADDAIDTAVRQGSNGDSNTLGDHAAGKIEQVRSWLTGRVMIAGAAARYPEASFTTEPGGWKRSEFIEAVEDPGERAFLLRFLELTDANDQLPSQGTFPRLCFGKRPGGAVFVYPFGRRFPPFKFSIKNGQLMISGCWRGNFKATGHPGFAEIASLLGQDGKGPARAVPVFGFDADELWNVGDRVSRAVN
jgi:hypothetical protein